MKPVIEYADFDKLDLRVGKVVAATAPEWSNKLLQFTVDFGPEIGERTILSGISKWFQPEFFVGKYFCFVVNLAERKMGEGVSQGMMLMADEADAPIPFAIQADVKPGLIIR
jgi:methionine--tRNA ligase beta chain